MAVGVAPIYIRLLPPLLVLFTTLLSLSLYSRRNSHYTGPLFNYVLSDRATVSLVIQFLSSSLGMAKSSSALSSSTSPPISTSSKTQSQLANYLSSPLSQSLEQT
jgi:hypothetical protein